MKLCSRCGTLLPNDNAVLCPACGARQELSHPHTAARPSSAPPVSPSAAATQDTQATSPPAQADPFAADAAFAATYGDAVPHIYHAPNGRTQRKTGRRTSYVRPGAAVRPSRVMSAEAAAIPRRQRAQGKTVRVLGVIMLLLTVALVLACFSTYYLYNKYNAEAAFDSLGNALLLQDIPTLKNLLSGDGVAVTDEGLAAFCKLFTTQESVDALTRQLTTQSLGQEPDTLPYPTVHPASQKVFLGYARHTVQVSPAALYVPIAGVGQSFVLRLDGAPLIGTQTEDGVLYSGLFPGVYEAVAAAQTLLGDTVTGPPSQITLLDSATPAQFDGALPLAGITVENCLSDSAAITVNGTAVSQTPVGGILTLPAVGVGSTIGMTFTTEYGATTTASVLFADKAVTTLKFENPVTEGGVPPEDQMNTLLAAWFTSFLNARNGADPAHMQGCTEVLRALLSAEITGDASKKVSCVAKTAQSAMSTVQQATYEGLPSLILNAKFTYTATDRANAKDTEHTALYTLELVYQEGWKVNRLVTLGEDFYAAGTFATLPAAPAA